MKKMIALLGIITLSLLFCLGCGTNQENNQTENNGNHQGEETEMATATIADYFPIKADTMYVYEGSGNEYASYSAYVDYMGENKIQQRVDNGGTVTVRVLEIKDGKLNRILSKGEVYYRENFLETPGTESDVLLMEPLAQGTTWNLADGSVRTITNTTAEVTTPLGSYQTIEVTTTNADQAEANEKNIDYYAKGVGLVKSVFRSGEDEITSSLSKIEDHVPLVQKINFYFPNIEDEKFYVQSREVSFHTNDVTREILTEAYKTPLDNTGKVFSENTRINSLYLNNDGMVYIDLNKAFLTEMNAGSTYEGMILQSIANTFGQYYNAGKVILTIDGQLYESGHFAFKKGEALQVNYDNIAEVK